MRIYSFIILFLTYSCLCHAQMTVSPGDIPPLNPQNIVENVFLGNGVEVISTDYVGLDASVGVFDQGLSAMGLNRGIVLSTGFAKDVSEVNSSTGSISANTIGTGIIDQDLENLSGVEVVDIAKFEIEFIPTADLLSFRYAFASEEYPDFVCDDKNDVFGFFISGPRPGGGSYINENIARIPDPNNQGEFLNLPVTINSVNGGTPGMFSDGNTCNNPNESLAYDIYYNTINEGLQPAFNAYLDVFIAQAEVIPCETYTIKIAIGDGNDQNKDSAVFLEEKSFSTSSIITQLNNPGINGELAEGCLDGSVRFSLTEDALVDFPLEIEILNGLNLPNIALEGDDYAPLPSNLSIAAGTSFVDLPIIINEDSLEEETEFIYLSIRTSVCNIDTLIIPILDNRIAELNIVDTIRTCRNQETPLESSINVDSTDPALLNFNNTTSIQISKSQGLTVSSITIAGSPNTVLSTAAISEICIDSLVHPRLSDLEFYLVSPTGSILELSTNNGFYPEDNADNDFLISTCFTVDANQNINLGNPVQGTRDDSNPTYTGNYLPEGNLEEWVDNNEPINGAYSLQIIDDTKEYDGTLYAWHINTNPQYQVEYNWQSNAQITCPTCSNTTGQFPSSQYVYLEVQDNFGCINIDSTWVQIFPNPAKPTLACDTTENSAITFSWPPALDAEFYQIQVLGQSTRWTNTRNPATIQIGIYEVEIVNNRTVTVRGLLSLEEIALVARSFNRGSCFSGRDTLSCIAPLCTNPIAEITEINISQPVCPDDTTSTVAITTNPAATESSLEYKIRANNTLFNDSGTFSAVPSGTWPLRVIIENGCTIEDSITILEPPAFTFEAAVKNITCHDFSDGSIQLTTLGDNGPFDIKWDDGADSNLLDNLSVGLYNVTVTDIKNCIFQETYEIINPDTLTYNYIQSDSLNCGGSNEIFATLDIIGGQAPYITTWNNQTVADTLNSITPGLISYAVVDSFGCRLTGETDVFQVDGLRISFENVTSNLDCFTDELGTATAIVSNGSGSYEYLWSNGEETATATRLNGALTRLTVTDSDGCVEVAEITLTAPEEIIIKPTLTAPSCFDMEDGQIDIDISGGEGSYTIAWDNGSSLMSISGLASGMHCVTVSDENLCTRIDCYDLPVVEEITLEAIVNNESCTPGRDGSISITPTGGSNSYTYNWTDGNNFLSTDQNLNGLSAGQYTVIVTDSNNVNCSSQPVTFDLIKESNIVAELIETDKVLCHGAATGGLIVEITAGAGPFLYDWSENVLESNEGTASSLMADTYTVTITDADNCSTVLNGQIEEPEEIVLTTNVNNVACLGESSGAIFLMVEGGIEPYRYLWSDGSTNANLSGVATGDFIVTVTDANDCTQVTTATITEPESAISISANISDVTCIDGDNGVIELVVTDAAEPITYSIDGSSLQTSNIFTNLSPDTYTVTAIDANSCIIEESYVINNASEFGQTLETQYEVEFDSSLELNAGNNPSNSYIWSAPFIENFSCTTCSNPTITNITRSFTASVLITDDEGCTQEVFIKINIVEKNNLDVPTGFSPNGDNINDILVVYGSSDIIVNEFRIYSRWGELIYEAFNFNTNELNLGWNGRFKGELVNQDSYVWTATYTVPSGQSFSNKGQVVVIK